MFQRECDVAENLPVLPAAQRLPFLLTKKLDFVHLQGQGAEIQVGTVAPHPPWQATPFAHDWSSHEHVTQPWPMRYKRKCLEAYGKNFQSPNTSRSFFHRFLPWMLWCPDVSLGLPQPSGDHEGLDSCRGEGQPRDLVSLSCCHSLV